MDLLLVTCKDLGGGVPDEIQVIPYGAHETPKGDFICDEQSEALVMTAFGAHKNDMVVDYEHQTLAGVEAPAAGWIKSLVNKGKEGIWAVVEWTDKAKAYIASREYRYVSPVFMKRLADNRVVELFNVALTNQPNIDGMVPLVNKRGNLAAPVTSKQNKEGSMNVSAILKALGLAEGATEAEVLDAIAKLKEQTGQTAQAANKAVCEALGLKAGAAESEVVGTVMAMKQGFSQTDGLSEKVVSLEARLAEKDAAELVAQAMKDGKITSAQEPWAKEYAGRDAEGFKVFVAKAPVVVPLAGLSKGSEKRDAGPDETQVQVNKMLGLNEDTFKKHNKEG